MNNNSREATARRRLDKQAGFGTDHTYKTKKTSRGGQRKKKQTLEKTQKQLEEVKRDLQAT